MTYAELINAKVAAFHLALQRHPDAAVRTERWTAYHQVKDQCEAMRVRLERERVDELKSRIESGENFDTLHCRDIWPFAVARRELGMHTEIIDRGVICRWSDPDKSWSVLRVAKLGDEIGRTMIYGRMTSTDDLVASDNGETG